jgi:DNA-binding NtrC family response regulator
MDTSPFGRVTPVEDAGSPPSHNAAEFRYAGRCNGFAPEATGHASGRQSAKASGCADVAYACRQASTATGFAEPPQEPGPKAPAAANIDRAEGGLEKSAEAFVGMPLADVERLVIKATIRACGGSLPKAALVLGVSPSTLYRKRADWID